LFGSGVVIAAVSAVGSVGAPYDPYGGPDPGTGVDGSTEPGAGV
jgi:hypothetical protein